MTQLSDALNKARTLSHDEVHGDGKADKPKKRRTPQFKRTKPVALEQLVVAYGHKKAGEMIGMSGSGLATAINRDDVSVPVERLAEMLLLNEGKQVVVPKERLVVARVPAAKAEVVLTFMKALGIKTMDFVP